MKHIALLLCICFALNNIALGQKTAHMLSFKDSLKADAYWDSADRSPLHSQKRQRYLDSALALTPQRAFFWQQKAMPLCKQKKYEIGMPYLDSAVKYDKREYIDYRAFMKCIFQKNYGSAIADFNTARRINGNIGLMDHSYDFYTGLCYLQLDRFDSAEYYIGQSINGQKKSLGDNWVHYMDLFYMGVVEYEKGNYAGAIENFDASLKQYKNFSDAKYYKAICLSRLNKKEAALKIALEGMQDIKDGYTINEDNSFYEEYPYQVRKYFFDNQVAALQSVLKGKKG